MEYYYTTIFTATQCNHTLDLVSFKPMYQSQRTNTLLPGLVSTRNTKSITNVHGLYSMCVNPSASPTASATRYGTSIKLLSDRSRSAQRPCQQPELSLTESRSRNFHLLYTPQNIQTMCQDSKLISCTPPTSSSHLTSRCWSVLLTLHTSYIALIPLA